MSPGRCTRLRLVACRCRRNGLDCEVPEWMGDERRGVQIICERRAWSCVRTGRLELCCVAHGRTQPCAGGECNSGRPVITASTTTSAWPTVGWYARDGGVVNAKRTWIWLLLLRRTARLRTAADIHVKCARHDRAACCVAIPIVR